MFKQFLSIFSKPKEEPNLNQEQLQSFFENDEFDAVRRILLSDPKTSLSDTQNKIIFNKFLDELKTGNTNASFSRFFYEKAITPTHEQILNILSLELPQEAKNYTLKIYLSKYSKLSLNINYLEASHPHEKFANYLVEIVNSENFLGENLAYFNNYLEKGSKNLEVDEFLFYLSSPTLAQHVSFDKVKSSSHASSKITRSIFSQLRQSSLEHIKHNKNLTNNNQSSEPPSLDKMKLKELPTEIYDMVQNIIDKSTKFQKINNFSHNPDDEYFLNNITSRYLPQTLSKYLQISPSFRNIILESQNSSATDILKETLQVYEKRISLIQDNILAETNRKLKLQGRFIQKLSQNLEHYQAGTADQIGELEIPPVEIKKVRLR